MIELSVVVPTLDATSERCTTLLRSIRAETPVPHEVVIVDNGGSPQGFTAPVNAALRAARGDYLVVCNDDVRVFSGWWGPLRAALEAGAKVVFPDSVGGFMRYDFAAWCFAMSRDTMRRFCESPGEFFDPAMKVWFQDTDLKRRLDLAGCPPVFVPYSQIAHEGSQTISDPAFTEQIGFDRQEFAAKWAVRAP
jgi:glycosyltransferase involved in cell wall biosynthesis